MVDLAKLVVKLEAQTAQYQAALEKAEAKLAKFSNTTDISLAKIGKSFAAVGAATAVALAALTKNAISTADRIGKISQTSGVAVGELSKLAFVFGQDDVEVEGLAASLQKLNKNLSEVAGSGKGDAADAFKAMGISVTDASGKIKSADKIIVEISNKFAGYEDGANKVALAMAIFGKSGAALIPTLNAGGEEIQRMSDKAERLGLVLDEKTTKAADDFNDRLSEMKAGLDGFGRLIAAELLPSLNNLGKIWDEDAGRLEAMKVAAKGVAFILKLIAAAAIVTTGVFQQFGQGIYTVGAALVRFASGDFKLAVAELKDGVSKLLGNADGDVKKLIGLFKKAEEEIAKTGDAMDKTGKKAKIEAPSISGLKEVGVAADKAITKLEDLNTSLNEQLATFNKTELAAMKYRLTVGDLAKAVAEAGPKGKALADSILETAKALESLRAQDAVANINIQIDSMTGKLKEAAMAAFDLQNALLKSQLEETGNNEGLKALEKLRSLTVAQAEYNELQLEAEKIQKKLAQAEESIRNSQEVGAISEIEALRQVSAEREKALEQLDKIKEKMGAVAEASENAVLIENVRDFTHELEEMEKRADLLAQKMNTDVKESFKGAFGDFITGAKNAADAFNAFADELKRRLADLLADWAANMLFGQGPTGGGGGGGGGWFDKIVDFGVGLISGKFGGAGGASAAKTGGTKPIYNSNYGPRADGGPVEKGRMYRVNERTANSEWFIPGMSGQIVPATGLGKQENHFHFSIATPDGRISRQTELQIGATAMRALSAANAKGN